jgi:predicted porin
VPEEEEEEEESGYRDITTLAVNYQRDLGEVTLIGSAAIMNGNGYGEGFKDFTAWLGGIQVGFADFTFGGGFGKFDGFNSIDWQWNIGATYEAGPFSVGAQYAWAKDVNGDKSWATGIGVNYVLAPGLSLQADYVHSRVNFDRSGSVNTADVVILGLQLSF